MLGAAATLSVAAPVQAQGEETPAAGPSVEFTDTCDGTTVTLVSGEDFEVYEWVIAHGEGATLEEVPAGESATVEFPPLPVEFSVTFTGGEEEWTHSWEEPEEGCADPSAPNDSLPDDVDADLVTITTCEVIVFILRNNGEEAGISFSLTPNQAATPVVAPEFVRLLDAEPNEDGFVEVPAELSDPAGDAFEILDEVGAGETYGPIGPQPVNGVTAHGFLAFGGLEITVEVTVGDEPVELDEPVTSWDEAAAGLGCGPDDGGSDGGEGGELPVTGASTPIIVAGAVALLVLGGGLYLLARRRRPTFTA